MAERECPYNSGVTCDFRTLCARCGFYPSEEKRRLKMIRAGRLEKNLLGKFKLRIPKKVGATSG